MSTILSRGFARMNLKTGIKESESGILALIIKRLTLLLAPQGAFYAMDRSARPLS